MDEIAETGTALLTYKADDRDAWLWHWRLSHRSTGYLKLLFPKFSKDMYCEKCVLAKSHRQTYKSNNTQVDSLFSLVHSNVWGPSPVLGGKVLNIFFFLWMIVPV